MTRRAAVMAALLIATASARADDDWAFGIGQLDQATRGLVGYWAMRNSGGTVFDERGGQNGIAAAGLYGYEYGTVGDGLRGDGATGYVDVSAHHAKWEQYATGYISAWTRLTDATQSSIFCINTTGKDQLVCLIIRAGADPVLGYARAGFANLVKVTGVTLTSNVWYHVVWASSGSAYGVWVDGVPATISMGTGSNDGKWFKAVDDVADLAGAYLGVFEGFTAGVKAGHLKGDLDEVRLGNVYPSNDEVKQLYRMGAIPRGIK